MGEGRERLAVGRDKETRKRRWGGSCMILQRWWCSLCAVFPPKLTEKGEREKNVTRLMNLMHSNDHIKARKGKLGTPLWRKHCLCR